MSDEITWTTATVRLGDLIPWEDNPRQMTEAQAERLQKSIDKYGYSQLLEIDADSMYVDGHQRDALFKAVKELGFMPDTNIEVRQANVAFTVEMRKEYMAWKHEGAAGEWNWEMMPNLFDLDELKEFGIENINFDFFKDEDPPEDPGAQVDKAEELREKWQVESGQLWQLGEHRLICGDCTDAEVVDRVMGGEKAGAVVTDPPYGMGYKGLTGKAQDGMTLDKRRIVEPVIGDDTPFDPSHIFDITANDYLLWGADWYYDKLPGGGSWSVWDKRATEESDAIPGAPFEVCWSKRKQARRIVRRAWGGWNNKDETGDRYHPTQKPIEVIEFIIGEFTIGTIFDLYLGSGTTLIACERLKRKCRGVEIEPKYVAVTLERWSQMTGDTPVLVD